MIGISPEICLAIKQARRTAKLSQQEIATEVGCKQSALSMFEQGDPTKLNEEVVQKLAAKFAIDLRTTTGKENENSTMGQLLTGLAFQRPEAHTGFCPNPNCPSNHRYQVEDRVLMLPNREVADPVGGKFCAMCGESLIRKCSNCGALVHPGAICSLCGEPYLALT